MCIYLFCIVLILLIITSYLAMKLYILKMSIRRVGLLLDKKFQIDTNMLITTCTNDKDLNQLVIKLNKSLKILRSQELKYKNGNQELQNIVVNISHDIRTPLTAVRGYIDLLKKENLLEKQNQYLKIIDNKTNELISLTDEFFDYTKYLDLKENVIYESNCINDILEDVLLEMYALFNENSIEPTINICKKKIFRNIDRSMLVRIFENILSNAIKYGDSHISISLNEDGKIIFSNKTKLLDTISVNKIFDRYFTVENAKKGNGVGLSIAKQLVELNNGNIYANYSNGELIIEIVF